jgi:choline dehydrogenase-like flavoprotein
VIDIAVLHVVGMPFINLETANRYGNGPLKIGISDFQFPDLKAYFAAFRESGADMPRDGNNGEAYGLSWYPNTMNPRTGERSHARNSYYDPISTRPNLKIMLETLATEIVFDTNNSTRKLTARGVQILDKKTNHPTTVYACKELILAAGAINTPKLLQLSGIGPRSVLQAAGITVKLAHDGVGANFQDHPYASVAFNSSNASTPSPASWADPAFNASAWAQYRANKTGPLTQARGNSLAMMQLPVVAPTEYLDIAKQVQQQNTSAYLPSVYKGSEKLLRGVAAQRKVLANLYQNDKAAIVEYPISASGGRVIVAHEKPLSRGTIAINPLNPQGPPNVLFNAMSNPVDKSVLAACVRYIRTIWARPELSAFHLIETSPGAQYVETDELIAKIVQSGGLWPTLAHPSGSCAMMPEEMGGCVSSELLFYGVEKMSIVDASILPIIPSQHIQSTMYAVGEKAADIIGRRG